METNVERYEKIYMKLFWVVLLVVAVFVYRYEGSERLSGEDLKIFKINFLGFLIAFNGIKSIFVLSKSISNERFFYLQRIVEILFAIIVANFFNESNFYILLLFPIISITILKGTWTGFFVGLSTLFFNFGFYLLERINVEALISVEQERLKVFSQTIEMSRLWREINLSHLFVLMIPLVAGIDYARVRKGEKRARTRELSRLRETNQMLEDSNETLSTINAELYTTHFIVKELNGILNIKQLAWTIQDIVLGIMGASHVSLFLVNNKELRLTLQTTTLQDAKSRFHLVDEIQGFVMQRILEQGQPICLGEVDVEELGFLKGRKVSSVMLIPIHHGMNLEGLLIVEHPEKDFFSEEMFRYMLFVGQQFSLAFEKVTLYTRMHEMVVRDGLTGIFNRMYFQDKLEEVILRIQKTPLDVVLVLLDVDHFKSYNDTYGHIIGDKVLQHIVSTVKDELRKHDLFARFGGEEFAIILQGVNEELAYRKIDIIRKKIEDSTLEQMGQQIKVTVSFGITKVEKGLDNGDECVKRADHALYKAKRNGRNRVEIYKDSY